MNFRNWMIQNKDVILDVSTGVAIAGIVFAIVGLILFAITCIKKDKAEIERFKNNLVILIVEFVVSVILLVVFCNQR